MGVVVFSVLFPSIMTAKPWLVRVSVAVVKHHDQYLAGRKWCISAYGSIAQFMAEGSQSKGTATGRQGPRVQKGCRDQGGMLLTGLFLLTG